jgi:hypothetical protein
VNDCRWGLKLLRRTVLDVDYALCDGDGDGDGIGNGNGNGEEGKGVKDLYAAARCSLMRDFLLGWVVSASKREI